MTLTQTEFRGELLFNAARQREVEILASEQEVLADGGALKFDVSPLDVGPYEAEVRGATSDVANQHELAVSQVLSDNVLMLRHPRIKGGQRFFQQSQVFESCLSRRFHRQLSSFLIERSRHGEDDFLVLEELLRIVAASAAIAWFQAFRRCMR